MFLFCDIYTMGSVDLALPLLENWEDLIRQWSLKSCLHVLMTTVCGWTVTNEETQTNLWPYPTPECELHIEILKTIIFTDLVVAVYDPRTLNSAWNVSHCWGKKMQTWLSFLFDWEKNVKLNSRSYVKIYLSMKLTADMKAVGPKKEKKRDEEKKTFAFGWRRHCFKNCKTLYWKRSIQYLSFCFLTVKDIWNDWSDCIKLVIEKAMEPQFNGKCLI